jgi:hypothetical protein
MVEEKNVVRKKMEGAESRNLKLEVGLGCRECDGSFYYDVLHSSKSESNQHLTMMWAVQSVFLLLLASTVTANRAFTLGIKDSFMCARK